MSGSIPTFIYDTKYNPLSFDIVFWLACCSLQSMDHNDEGIFDVILVVDGYRDVGIEAAYSSSYRIRKCYSVLIKIVSICKWVRNFTVARTSESLAIAEGTRVLPASWRHALTLDQLSVPQHIISPMTTIQVEELMQTRSFKLHGFEYDGDLINFANDRLIIIHPRCSDVNGLRNTPIEIFNDLQEFLVKEGYHVKCIPDIDDLLGDNIWAKSFDCLSHASSDPLLRVGYSLGASLNILWAAGNPAPLMFSRASFLLFGLLNDSIATSSRDFFARKGPVVGRNPKWFGKNQRLDWTRSEEVTASYMRDSIFAVRA